MDIKLKTEAVVSNPTIISYGLIGLTTMVLGYFTFFDGEDKEETKEEIPSEEVKPSEEPTEQSLFEVPSAADFKPQSLLPDNLFNVQEPQAQASILQEVSEPIVNAVTGGRKKTRGQRRKRRQNKSSKHRK